MESKDAVINKKILLITKNFPPQIWGMEYYSDQLYKELQKSNHVRLIKNSSWKKWLPFLALKCLLLWPFYSIDSEIVWTCDASISPIWFFLSQIFKLESKTTAHWLDITWRPWWYQKMLRFFLKRMDQVVAVSKNTIQECVDRGVENKRIVLAPNKLTLPQLIIPDNFDRTSFLKTIWIDLDTWNKQILLSVWRWIERKWFHCFLNDIIPSIPQGNYHYIMVWFGPMKKEYYKIIKLNNIKNVTMLEKISDDMKQKLYLSADKFIMPNIQVENDIEWFGIVLLEAAHYWLEIIVNPIQGIQSAINERLTNYKQWQIILWWHKFTHLFHDE